MNPLDYIRIDSDILQLDLPSTDKIILGAVKSFNGRGLMLSNEALAKMLNSKPNTIAKSIGRLKAKKLIHIEKEQSRYRLIYWKRIF